MNQFELLWTFAAVHLHHWDLISIPECFVTASVFMREEDSPSGKHWMVYLSGDFVTYEDHSRNKNIGILWLSTREEAFAAVQLLRQALKDPTLEAHFLRFTHETRERLRQSDEIKKSGAKGQGSS